MCMSSKSTTIWYWITTGLIAAFMLMSGIGHLAQDQMQVDMMQQLGYPQHILITLGIAKVLGALVLIVPRIRVLKEWAYAGFTFDLLGAAIAIALSPMGFLGALLPLAFFIPLVPSYLLWKRKTGQNITL